MHEGSKWRSYLSFASGSQSQGGEGGDGVKAGGGEGEIERER